MTSGADTGSDGLVLAPDVLHRVVGDEVFVLMPGGRVHWLRRPVARFLWDTIVAGAGATPETAESLAARVVLAFDVELAVAARDVQVFVAELVTLGVLTGATR